MSRRASEARRPLAGLALGLTCLVVWLPGFVALPAVDRDESRFLLAARTMATTGDWWLPHLGDRPRLEKPPLATWLQAGTILLATGGEPRHDAPWMGRLPSLLAALATVLALWRVGGRLVDPRAAWLAALLLGLSPLVVSQTHQARADLVLLLPSTLCLLALARVWRSARRGGRPPTAAVLTFWLALLCAVLAKGPITPWIVIATAAGLAAGEATGHRLRWLRSLRVGPGLATIAAILGILVWEQSRAVGLDVLSSTAYRETVGRVLGGLDGHFAPPGLHTLLAPVLLWPGSLGLFGALAWSWRKARPGGRRGASPSCRFLLAWALPAWLGFELAATKLPHYPLPLHVPLLLLAARWLLRLAARRPILWPGWLRWPLIAWQVVPAAALPVGLGAIVALATGSRLLALAAAGIALALLGCAAASVRRRPLRALAWALAGWGCVAVTLGFVLPRWSAPWTAVRLAAAVDAADPTGSRPLADAAWGEASLPLLTRRPVVRLSADAVPSWLATHPGALAVMPAAEVGETTVLAGVEGFDLVHGRWVALALIAASPP